MTSLIKNQLLKRLTRYVKNMSREQLHISSLRGSINLNNLEFDEDAMTDLLELPEWLRIRRMSCSKVHVAIPWTQLTSKSIKIVLDEVCVDIVTCDELRPPKTTSSASSVASSSSDKGFGSVTGGAYGFIEKAIDGVQLIINLVDVNFYTPRFHISVHIDRLDIYSCTPKWQPTTDNIRHARVKSEARGQTLIFKRLDWQVMRLTAQARVPDGSPHGTEASGISSSFRILASASILLKMKRRLADSSIVFATLSVLLDETLCVLTDSQLINACGLVEDLHKLIVKANEATKLERARQRLDDLQKSREGGGGSGGGKSTSPAKRASAASSTTTTSSGAAALPGGLARMPSTMNRPLTKEELFTMFDMQETSYHVQMRALELQMCDETADEGSMRIQLQTVHVDLFPFHCESWSTVDFNVETLGDFDIFSNQRLQQRYEDTVIIGSAPSPANGSHHHHANRSTSVRPNAGGSKPTYLPHNKERLAWKKKLLLAQRIQFTRSMLHAQQQAQRVMVSTSTTTASSKPLQPAMDNPLLLSSNVLVCVGDIMMSAVTKSRAATLAATTESQAPVYDAPLVMNLREILKLPTQLPVVFVEHVEFFFPAPPGTAADAANKAANNHAATGNAATGGGRRDTSHAGGVGLPAISGSQLPPPLAMRSTSHVDASWSHASKREAPMLTSMTSVNENAGVDERHHLEDLDDEMSSQQPQFGGGISHSSSQNMLSARVPNSLLYVNVNPMQVTLHIDSIEWFAGRLKYILPELSDLLLGTLFAPVPVSGSEFIERVSRSAASKMSSTDTDMFIDCMMLKAVLPTQLPAELVEEMPFHGTFGTASFNEREKQKPAALVVTVSNLTIKNNLTAFDRLAAEEWVDDGSRHDHHHQQQQQQQQQPPLLTVDNVFERILHRINNTTDPASIHATRNRAERNNSNTANKSTAPLSSDQQKLNFIIKEMQRRYEYGCTHRGPSALRSVQNQQTMLLISIEQVWVESEGPAFFAMPIVRQMPLRVAVVSLNAASLVRQVRAQIGSIDPQFATLLAETVESVALVWITLPTRRAVAQLQRVVLHAFIRAIDRLTMVIDDINMAITDVVVEQHAARYAPLVPSALRHGSYLLLMTDAIDEACADLVLTLKPAPASSSSNDNMNKVINAAAAADPDDDVMATSVSTLKLNDDAATAPHHHQHHHSSEQEKRVVHFDAEPPKHGDAAAEAHRARPSFMPLAPQQQLPHATKSADAIHGGEFIYDSEVIIKTDSKTPPNSSAKKQQQPSAGRPENMASPVRSEHSTNSSGLVLSAGSLMSHYAGPGGGNDNFKDTDSIYSESGVSSVPSESKLDEIYRDDDASSLADTSSITDDFVRVEASEIGDDMDDDDDNVMKHASASGPVLAEKVRRNYSRFVTCLDEPHNGIDNNDDDAGDDDDDEFGDAVHSPKMTRSETLVKRGSVVSSGKQTAVGTATRSTRADSNASYASTLATTNSHVAGKSSPSFIEDLRDRQTFAVQNIGVIVESWPRKTVPPTQSDAGKNSTNENSSSGGGSRGVSPTRHQVPRSLSILVVRVALQRVKIADTARLQWKEVQQMFVRPDEKYAQILQSSFPLTLASPVARTAAVAAAAGGDEAISRQISILFVKDPLEEGVVGKKGRVEIAVGGLALELQHHIANALGDFGADFDFLAMPGGVASQGQLPIKLYLHDLRVCLGEMPLLPRYHPSAPAAITAAGAATDKKFDPLGHIAVSPTTSAEQKTKTAVAEVNEMFGDDGKTTKNATTSPTGSGGVAKSSKTDDEFSIKDNSTVADLQEQLDHFEMMRKNAEYMVNNIRHMLAAKSEQQQTIQHHHR